MTDLNAAVLALECCIESDETGECPPGCPFSGDPDCESMAKRLARDVLKRQQKKPYLMTADELRGMDYGHGWVEYFRDDPEIPFEEYLQERVWVRGQMLECDCKNGASTGPHVVDGSYNKEGEWRMWTNKPSQEDSSKMPWFIKLRKRTVPRDADI